MKGILRVLRPLPTLIAIPTTAGTGSETTLAAVIIDSEKHHKYALMSFPLIPHYAVLDPVLTYSLPQSLTATTGIDALTSYGETVYQKLHTLGIEAGVCTAEQPDQEMAERFIVDKKTWLDLPMRYQPYQNKLYETLLRIFLK